MSTRPTMEELRARVGVQGKKYADMPGTGPAGRTCRSCVALVYSASGSRYPKCGRTKWTRGDATTIRVTSPACRLYEEQQP
ncbi:MAG: hypothetical protein V4617_15230 [Gemmatimonadota bacterium]